MPSKQKRLYWKQEKQKKKLVVSHGFAHLKGEKQRFSRIIILYLEWNHLKDEHLIPLGSPRKAAKIQTLSWSRPLVVHFIWSMPFSGNFSHPPVSHQGITISTWHCSGKFVYVLGRCVLPLRPKSIVDDMKPTNGDPEASKKQVSEPKTEPHTTWYNHYVVAQSCRVANSGGSCIVCTSVFWYDYGQAAWPACNFRSGLVLCVACLPTEHFTLTCSRGANKDPVHQPSSRWLLFVAGTLQGIWFLVILVIWKTCLAMGFIGLFSGIKNSSRNRT